MHMFIYACVSLYVHACVVKYTFHILRLCYKKFYEVTIIPHRSFFFFLMKMVSMKTSKFSSLPLFSNKGRGFAL